MLWLLTLPIVALAVDPLVVQEDSYADQQVYTVDLMSEEGIVSMLERWDVSSPNSAGVKGFGQQEQIRASFT